MNTNIAAEDLEGFKDIRKGLGEQMESNVELDAEEPQSDQKIDQMQRQSSVSSSNIDYDLANAEEQDQLIRESLKRAGLDPSKVEDARPSGLQMQKAMKYFDLAVKMEVTLYDLKSMCLNISICEIGFFVLGFMFFLDQISKMKSFLLFFPHFFRGICGFLIHKKLPSSHHFVSALEFEEDRAISFDELHERLKFNVERIFFKYVKETRKLFKIYLGLSILGAIFDFFNFVVVLSHFGKPGEEYQEITIMLMSCVFYGTNMYWFGYAYLLQKKFPQYISKYIMEAVRPYGVIMEKKLQTWERVALEKSQRVQGNIKSKFNRSAQPS